MSGLDSYSMTAVRRGLSKRRANAYALCLTAMGLRSSIVPEHDGLTLYVPDGDWAQANSELIAYDHENRPRPAPKKLSYAAMPNLEVALVYWAVLLFFFAATRRDLLAMDPVEAGAVQVGLMQAGEWWRAVTALTLHLEADHLFGNLVFGTVVALLLAQVTGSGAAWLAMLTAGALGNVASTFLQPDYHTSIGASTAVFAGIGLLAALRQDWRPGFRDFNMRDWIPLAGGITLVVFLGLSGENTDITAHVTGFVSGIALGWALSHVEIDWHRQDGLQLKCGLGAAGLLGLSWLVALVL